MRVTFTEFYFFGGGEAPEGEVAADRLWKDEAVGSSEAPEVEGSTD